MAAQTLPADVREQAAAFVSRDAVPWPLLRSVCRALRDSGGESALPRPWFQDLARSGGLKLPSTATCVSEEWHVQRTAYVGIALTQSHHNSRRPRNPQLERRTAQLRVQVSVRGIADRH